jgi:glycosyltransferase involved in cell wall biosynthesis
MPSRGEGFCIPALEAMAMGIPVIYTEGTGMDDFCSGRHGNAVHSSEVPCFGAMSTIDYLYTANEKWNEIDLEALMFAMRESFMKWNTEFAVEESRIALEQAKKYSHKKIGMILKEILNDC